MKPRSNRALISQVRRVLQDVASRQRERERLLKRRLPLERPERCGAKTRSGYLGNAPCRRWPVPGRRRCRLHGGLALGATSREGLARLVEAGRRGGIASGIARRAKRDALLSQDPSEGDT